MQKRGLVVALVLGVLFISLSFASAFSFSDFFKEFYGKITGKVTGNIVNEGCPSGLVSYYKFEGNTNDSSGNGNTGQIIGGVSSVQGKVGNAYQFDGNTGYIKTPYSSGLGVSNALSVSAWVYFQGEGYLNNLIVAAKDSSGFTFAMGRGFLRYHCGAHGVIFSLANPTWTDYCFSNSIIDNGKWYHIVETFDGSTSKIYFNGTLVSSLPVSGSIRALSSNGYLYIGGYEGEKSNVIVDEVSVWNKVLSASQISELYNNGNGKDVCTSVQQITCTTTRSCADTDNGINITLNGSVSSSSTTSCSDGTSSGGGGSPAVDSCVSSSVVRERYCSPENYSNYTDINCGSGSICSSGKCIVNQTSLPLTCIDSDGLDYYTAGTTIWPYQGQPWTSPDSCINSTRLLEIYCPGIELYYDCPNGCSNGACINQTNVTILIQNINCTDSDNGLNYYVKGYLNSSVSPGTNFEDYCLDSITLLERYCTSDPSRFTQLYNCSDEGKICSNGACIQNITSSGGGGGSATTTTVNTTASCNGCLFNNNCLPVGYRFDNNGVGSYCDISGIFPQKVNTENITQSCQNDFECGTNLCSDGQCVSLQGFTAGIVKLVCRITSIFSGTYEECVSQYVLGVDVTVIINSTNIGDSIIVGNNSGGGSCGDGNIDVGEECDGVDFVGDSCMGLSDSSGQLFVAGNLSCNSSCKIDNSGCYTQQDFDFMNRAISSGGVVYTFVIPKGVDPEDESAWMLLSMDYGVGGSRSDAASSLSGVTGDVINNGNAITGFDTSGGTDCTQFNGNIPFGEEERFDVIVADIWWGMSAQDRLIRISNEAEKQAQPIIDRVLRELKGTAKTNCENHAGCTLDAIEFLQVVRTEAHNKIRSENPDCSNQNPKTKIFPKDGPEVVNGEGDSEMKCIEDFMRNLRAQRQALFVQAIQDIKGKWCTGLECNYITSIIISLHPPVQVGKKWQMSASFRIEVQCEQIKLDISDGKFDGFVKAGADYTCKAQVCKTSSDEGCSGASPGDDCTDSSGDEGTCVVNNGGTCSCTPPCGNNVIDSGEECDKSGPVIPSDQTCESAVGKGYTGALSCLDSCKIDTTGCTYNCKCADGVTDCPNNDASQCSITGCQAEFTCTDGSTSINCQCPITCDPGCYAYGTYNECGSYCGDPPTTCTSGTCTSCGSIDTCGNFADCSSLCPPTIGTDCGGYICSGTCNQDSDGNYYC